MFIDNQVAVAYKKHYEEIQAKLERISFLIKADSANGVFKNWGHVGNVGYVNEMLGEILRFISS